MVDCVVSSVVGAMGLQHSKNPKLVQWCFSGVIVALLGFVCGMYECANGDVEALLWRISGFMVDVWYVITYYGGVR